MTYKLYLVDDARETLETLRLQYEIHPEIEIAGMEDDPEAAWDAMVARQPDVVSIDIDMGKNNGFDLCAKVVREMPGVFVVMCSVDADEERMQQAVRAGASWFLPKPVSYRDIRRLLDAVGKSRGEGPEKARALSRADESSDEDLEAWSRDILGDL